MLKPDHSFKPSRLYGLAHIRRQPFDGNHDATEAGWRGMLLLAAFVAAMVTLQPEKLKAPIWLAYLAAGITALCACLALAPAYRRPLLADGLACIVLGSILVLQVWVAFGPGPRHCVGRLHSLAPAAAISEAACRTAFGAGALIASAMLLLAIRGWRVHRPKS